jgi:hypothetical protein
MPNYEQRRRNSAIEPLETRQLLSGAFPNIDVSATTGNQAEGAIAVNRADPLHLFSVANIDVGDGLLAATSSDGGSTWSRHMIADDHDGLPPACCDPSAVYDGDGNLFLAYLNSKTNEAVVALSTDNGQSFHVLDTFRGDIDQPTITAGHGSVWVMFQKSNVINVAGASDNGLNQVGAFSELQHVRGSNAGNFGDIAIGPAGQVMVAYQREGGHNRSRIMVNVDPDGLGPAPFGKPIVVTQTRVGNFDNIPAQPTRGIDAEASLAFDRSGGPFNGRAYLLYNDQRPAGSDNLDVFIRYSDNQGVTWSNPIRLNDDTGVNSQFLPRLSEDDTTGKLAASWYDSRNDVNAVIGGSTNGKTNDDAQFFATVITPEADGLRVSANQQISGGTSNAAAADNAIDLGDYTGLDFFNGVLHPFWADNSNSTGDNPDGSLKDLDMYTANVPTSAFAAGPDSLGGVSDAVGPVADLYPGASPKDFVTRGGTFTFVVNYSDPGGVDASSLDDSDLLVTGPDGFSAPATFVRAARRSRGTVYAATYRLTAPDNHWSLGNDGSYTVTLQPGQVTDASGTPAAGGILGGFAVLV